MNFRVLHMAHVTKKIKNHKKTCESESYARCEKTLVLVLVLARP